MLRCLGLREESMQALLFLAVLRLARPRLEGAGRRRGPRSRRRGRLGRDCSTPRPWSWKHADEEHPERGGGDHAAHHRGELHRRPAPSRYVAEDRHRPRPRTLQLATPEIGVPIWTRAMVIGAMGACLVPRAVVCCARPCRCTTISAIARQSTSISSLDRKSSRKRPIRSSRASGWFIVRCPS